MFKRQFYAVDHADNENDDASSSDSSVNTGSDEDSAHEQEDDAASPSHAQQAPSDSEDSDDEDRDGERPEDESEDDEWNAYRDKKVKLVQPIDSSHFLSIKPTTEAVDESDKKVKGPESVGDGVVLRVKGVLKCRYCVKTLCLSDEMMTRHLLSQRHARSLKLLASGHLRVRLNSDGEEEEEGETHAERLERIRSIAEEKVVPAKRKANKGRQRQRKRAKKRAGKAERALAKAAKQKSE